MHLFQIQAIRNLFVSLGFDLRGAKLFLDTVMNSLGLMRLPWSQCHLTTFSAALLLVTADAP